MLPDRRAERNARQRARYASDSEYREKRKARRARDATKPETREKENARVRARYASDPEYRRKVLAQNAAYMKAHPELNRRRTKAWRDEHPDEKRADSRNYYARSFEKYRARMLRKKYGLTLAEFSAMQKAQDGRCAACKVQFNNEIRDFWPCVDHEHGTGQIRGILCHLCNTTIGQAHDNIKILLGLVRYLRRAAEKGGLE
jgi:hypothetical protein